VDFLKGVIEVIGVIGSAHSIGPKNDPRLKHPISTIFTKKKKYFDRKNGSF
jgi:hypothetical protein